MLPGLAPPASLRLAVPVWGLDTSTVRMSCAALIPHPVRDGGPVLPGPYLVCDTLSLPRGTNLAARQAAAVRAMVPWLDGLLNRWGMPGVIGYEAPLAGTKTPLPSFYVVGALLVAIGEVFDSTVQVEGWSPGEWKLAATGQGYIRGLSKSTPRDEKRRAEKARLLAWARDVAGYVGELEDEADAVGVVTATGVRFERFLSV